MKTILLSLMLTLSMTSAFAKGGDNDWIPDFDLQQRLKAAKQVKVVIAVENNLNSFLESTNDFTDFIGRLEGNLAQNFSVSRSVHSHSFCIQAKNAGIKKSLLHRVNYELGSYPENVSIKIYESLNRPCK